MTITIPTPHVPHGPEGVEPRLATAGYLEAVLRKVQALDIEGRRRIHVGGSNVTATIEKLLSDVAAALRDEVHAENTVEFVDRPTLRGFTRTSFKHQLYGRSDPLNPHFEGTFSVQESSLASERKVWVGFSQAVPTPANLEHPELEGAVDRAHLSETEALIVVRALVEWLSESDDEMTAMRASVALAPLGETENWCQHTGERENRFGGEVLCARCRRVIGWWKDEQPRVSATRDEETGEFKVVL